jgi:uncharacterized repeat protein (TIGR03803 family)
MTFLGSTSFSQRISRSAVAVLAVAWFAFLAATLPAFAQNETILYSFCRPGCADGAAPDGGLLMDSAGNLFGTTYGGGNGPNHEGVVYKLTPRGVETVLHTFGAPDDSNEPSGQLIMDTHGNLFGTTRMGGSNNTSGGGDGTVFKLRPDGTETILYSFGATSTDGNYPVAGVIMDAEGNLYGTTYTGGVYGAGTVFRLTPQGVETVLHSFASDSTDGGYPWAGLIMDNNGNLYGTTRSGGTGYEGIGGGGTVFEISANGEYSILHNFAGVPSDGSFVNASVTFDSQGNLYGTTYYGGADAYNTGTVFKLTPGSNGSWDETLLYNFTDLAAACQNPTSAVVFDAAGSLYGTTAYGGTYGGGCLYSLSPTGKLATVHAFGESPDGAQPYGNLLMSEGYLYGVTIYGGNKNDGGIVFKLQR